MQRPLAVSTATLHRGVIDLLSDLDLCPLRARSRRDSQGIMSNDG
jgi:hypothetical protein